MTTAVAPLGNIAKLATVAVRYVRDTPAPEPCDISISPSTHTISIQPTVTYPAEPVNVLGTLLIWTHRLTGVTGDWWHIPSGDLHITLTGRGPCGTHIRVYSSFRYRDARPHVQLAKAERESVTPDELYRLALELRDAKAGDRR